MQISPEQLAKVKKTLNVAAPTGGPAMGSLADRIKKSKALADGREVNVVKKTSAGFPGSNRAAALGEVTITADAIKKPTPPAAKKEPEFGTYNLPDVVTLPGWNIDAAAYKRALKKAEMTYGAGSRELRILRDVAGDNFSDTYKSTFKKPDLRGDTNSYVDTAQNVYNRGKWEERKGGQPVFSSDDFDAINLLRTLGELKGQRNLSGDKKSVDRSKDKYD